MKQRTVMVALVMMAVAAAAAQDRPTSTEPAFEVASVKANPRDDVPEAISLQATGVRFTAFRARLLIAMAYRSEGIQRFDQIIGGPSWIAVDRFDIAARAGDTAPDKIPAMLRSLLRDRFQLRVHTDRRTMPAYALVMARRDRALGPGLRESTIDCPAAGATDADPDRWCGIRATGGLIVGRAVSPTQLAGNLGGYPTVDRYVTDRTGLTGRYDFRLEYSPVFAQPGDASPNTSPNTGPSLFTALTEQLGLALRPERVELPVLVVDNIEKPTPD